MPSNPDAGRAPDLDRALAFSLPARAARGRLVRLGPLLADILSAHDYPAPIARILSEALTLTALFGAMLKEAAGQLTLQAQSESGIIDLLVCDYRGGELRGYVRFDRDRLASGPGDRDLARLFGGGYLAITFDQSASGERYQGIVPLEGASLAAVAESYFSQSEQIPSFVRLCVDDTGRAAGGILVQHLPEGEAGRDRIHTRLDHPQWDHVLALAQTVKAAELTDASLPLDILLWRLFHEEEEIRLLSAAPLSRGCRCSLDHIRSVLARFPPAEQADMVEADGLIRVECEFCSRDFPVALADLAS